jgi:oligopeptide transport system ATP-binding protein
MTPSDPLLTVTELTKTFPVGGRGRRSGEDFTAVDGVTFAVPAAGATALVGESGSGKTTIARIIVGLERATSGRVVVAGHDRTQPPKGAAERRRRGREAQMIFQDPYSSLDPLQRVGDVIGEVLDLYFSPSASERADRIAHHLEQVGLSADQARVRPAALSGGQRQRVAIARAIAAQPQLLVLDEAVAALDVSIQAQVLNLLADLRDETGIAYLFVSHDLAVVRQVTDDALVMQRGRIVESGPTEQVLGDPQHPYTQLLLESVPQPGWKPRRRTGVLAACG